MHPSYSDILNRIPEPPVWYTHDGVPRYNEWQPREESIYASYSLLTLIQCQDCPAQMLVGRDFDDMGLFRSRMVSHYYAGGNHNDLSDLPPAATILELAQSGSPGDPPHHGCPGAGETMGCVPIKIVKFWVNGSKCVPHNVEGGWKLGELSQEQRQLWHDGKFIEEFEDCDLTDGWFDQYPEMTPDNLSNKKLPEEFPFP